MRISDWSSDVCSSDLLDVSLEKAKIGPELLESLGKGLNNLAESAKKMNTLSDAAVATNDYAKNVQSASKSLSEMNKSYDEIGRESCRERVCQYVEIPVVAVSLKKKKEQQK